MTTIAYRDGILAADTGMVMGGSRVGHTVKIKRREDGCLAGAAGYASYSWAFLQWFIHGSVGDPPEGHETDSTFDRGVIFQPNGFITIYEPQGMFEIEALFYAIGTGAPEARGAMQYGASAEEAVRVAIKLDIGTFGEVEVLTHD